YSQRVVLTTYPGQVGINPIPLNWGAPTPEQRGPVVASRQPKSLKVRNAIGAYGGSYSVYRALASASGAVDPNHRPDYTNTEPPFTIAHNPAWDDPKKIGAMDPYGHLAPTLFKSYFDAGIDVRPTISMTRAHLKLSDFDDMVRNGTLEVDGKIVLNVSKAAIDPVWNLPEIARRFGVSEGTLRRCLFEECGGALPELLTRHDIKTYLPPIGGSTAYIFGNPDLIANPETEITVRVHDECNGSDVFSSDVCTCRPYLMFGIEEAVKCAQRGGVGIVVYFRKEGRALGEVLKYLVYNARKRSGDNAADYFRRTADIAGVEDMRFQVLMPDVLHWLGVKHIHRLVSMSNLKYNAITGSGITVGLRYEIPEDLIPPDSRVEIDAKIAHGYFSKTQVVNLANTSGRMWEDLAH
ncbi:uncharacterized protein RHOBADRAFT_17093, partial [Rhodotorula graminis WP1]